MASLSAVTRRSARLLNAVHELHKQGYQNLACFCYISASNGEWSLKLAPFSEIYVARTGELAMTDEAMHEISCHSSGTCGNQYFGWKDAVGASARELANLIKRRFSLLIEQSKGENFKYAGWFTYMLGFAEQGALPVFFMDGINLVTGKVKTTADGIMIDSPPHHVIQHVNGLEFLWASEPDVECDWHASYYPVIDSMHKTKIPRFPKYPSHTTDLIAHAAYWEGAIYYLRKKLGYRCEHHYIKERVYTNSRWREFETIFDSEGQLHLLDSHLARVALKYSEAELSEPLKKECRESLTNVRLMYQECDYKYPNPYFGGENPLHLTRLVDVCGG